MSAREVEVARCEGCGQWVQVGEVCDVCTVDACACGHPVEWHGRFGCRGWHLDDKCPCKRTESDAIASRREVSA
jgi:hypothetical protein